MWHVPWHGGPSKTTLGALWGPIVCTWKSNFCFKISMLEIQAQKFSAGDTEGKQANTIDF